MCGDPQCSVSWLSASLRLHTAQYTTHTANCLHKAHAHVQTQAAPQDVDNLVSRRQALAASWTTPQLLPKFPKLYVCSATIVNTAKIRPFGTFGPFRSRIYYAMFISNTICVFLYLHQSSLQTFLRIDIWDEVIFYSSQGFYDFYSFLNSFPGSRGGWIRLQTK